MGFTVGQNTVYRTTISIISYHIKTVVNRALNAMLYQFM